MASHACPGGDASPPRRRLESARDAQPASHLKDFDAQPEGLALPAPAGRRRTFGGPSEERLPFTILIAVPAPTSEPSGFQSPLRAKVPARTETAC